jgi:hypothetical protein
MVSWNLDAIDRVSRLISPKDVHHMNHSPGWEPTDEIPFATFMTPLKRHALIPNCLLDVDEDFMTHLLRTLLRSDIDPLSAKRGRDRNSP